ncbi:unnamed protein product, partial [Mesorhabditis belari]|uniref:Replication protein A subunit n=1 Tax=Mesorhabditis belari TaxID=2138241 RepID=A0AAF3F4W0_9BILA
MTAAFVPKEHEEAFKKYADSLRKLYLSVGFFQKLFATGGKPQGTAIVQIHNFKYEGKENFGARARASDGLFIYSCLFFHESLVDKLKKDGFPQGLMPDGNYPVIALNKYHFSSDIAAVGGTKTPIVIEDYEYITTCGKIDNALPLPTSLNDIRDYDNYEAKQILVPVTVDEGIPTLPPVKRPPVPPPQPRNVGLPGNVPIASITPYLSKFRILGLCTSKEDIRTIQSQARGALKVLNFDVTDDRGDSIRVVAFGELADKMNAQIQENCSYYLSNCSVRQANKRFNSTGHDYELSLRTAEDVIPCLDHQIDKPPFQLRRVMLNNVAQHKGDGLIDVLAVVDNVGSVNQFTARNGNEVVKRDVTLIDESGTQVAMTLWAQHAKDFDDEGTGHTIGIKGALVREFNGMYSITAGARFEMDPMVPGCKELLTWYMTNRESITPVSISMGGGDRSSAASLERDFTFLDVAIGGDYGKGEEKGHYFTIKGFFNGMKMENALYQACATEGCQKKVIIEQNAFRCEKCNKTMDNFKWNIILQAELIDYTGIVWTSLFSKACEQLLGMTAQQLGELRDSNQSAYEEVFQRAKFTPYLVRVRAKSEFYNEEERIKYQVFSVDPIDYDHLLPMLARTVDAAEKFHGGAKVEADDDMNF